MESLENTIGIYTESKRIGSNFLGILNDLKRRPEDAARELDVDLDLINGIISGEIELPNEVVKQAVKIWPVNERDFYIISDDCINGVKIMRSEKSESSRRIMERANKPYYEYRDTVSSTLAPFRPEWIMELCYVEDNDPNNSDVQWNHGHFMHQFTYFIGDVNFYYKGPDGSKNIAVMNTGDSMYITPFTPHTFATRKNSKQNGLILALTFGNKILGDVKQELSAISSELGQEFALDFSSNTQTISSLLKFHRQMSSIGINELSVRTKINKDKIEKFELGNAEPSKLEIENIADVLNVNVRDLIPNDKIEDKVIIQHNAEAKTWNFPEDEKRYHFTELANSKTLPYSKPFEIDVCYDDKKSTMDLKMGLHQYVYNVSEDNISLNWLFNNKLHCETIHPGDSVYIKPFVNHNFRGNGKLLVLRLGGKIVGDSQRELSIIGKENVKRAVDESMQWFDPKGHN
jgi:methylphosphonate synthase